MTYDEARLRLTIGAFGAIAGKVLTDLVAGCATGAAFRIHLALRHLAVTVRETFLSIDAVLISLTLGSRNGLAGRVDTDLVCCAVCLFRACLARDTDDRSLRISTATENSQHEKGDYGSSHSGEL